MRPPHPRPSPIVLASFSALIALLAGCQVSDESTDARRDTGVLPATIGDSVAGVAALGDTLDDSLGVPAVPNPSDSAAADSAVIRIDPDTATVGDVLFALAEGIAVSDPRCTWQGAAVPCSRRGSGVLAIVPVGFETGAGRGTLVFERPGGRLAREIPIEGRELPRELVFVPDSLFRLTRQRADIARDARVLQRVLSAPPAESGGTWSASWRTPVAGTARGFGAERFYYPASDSSRSIRLESGLRAAGVFGVDTAASGPNAVPAWRWGGVDYDVRAGTAVVAPAAGTVADAGTYTLTGNTLVLDHGRGVLSVYYHLDTVLVRKGEELTAGRTIGRVGSTGLTSRPRLHWAVFVHGRPVDPRGMREIPPFAR